MLEISRRTFLASAGAFAQTGDRIIDIHQHTNYVGRSDEALIAHQQRMGITATVLLPAGSRYGLAASAGGNETVLALARAHPGRFYFFANEVPDNPDARAVIEKYLKLGAIGIGEQKFPIPSDSAAMHRIAEIARDYRVPVLMHFEHGGYNFGFERFHQMLEKYPAVNFIGHAQTWWGNIDRENPKTVLYPKTPVTGGGITARLLADYSNMYGDLSAGSGLNALLRDEEHASGFLIRHQDKLLYGSDCPDVDGAGDRCIGAKQLAALRRLAPDARVLRKILYGNASRLLKIK